MIYGRSYEGRTRECGKCGHSTNVHMPCACCEASICENCAYEAGGQHYCWACTECGPRFDREGLPVRRSAAREEGSGYGKHLRQR